MLDEELRGMAFHPNDPNIVYLSGREVYVSNSNGDIGTWEYTTGGLASAGYSGLDLNALSNTFSVFRINIATTPAAPDRLYAYVSGPFSPQYQSGLIFVLENNVWKKKHQDIFDIETLDYLSDSWNAMAVSPQNKDIVYYAGSKIWEVDISDNNPANNTATDISGYGGSTNESFHADVHSLVIHPSFPDDLYCAHHGGVATYNSTKNNPWLKKNNGLMTELIWSFDDSEGDDNYMMAAYQDFAVGVRGSNPSNVSQWKKIGGGDGFGAQLDDRKKNEGYMGTGGSNSLKEVTGTSTSPVSWTNLPKLCIDNGITKLCENPKGFKMVNHPVTEELYYGRTEIHRLKANNTEWETVSDMRSTFPAASFNAWDRKIAQFTIAPSNPDYIYVLIQGAPELNMSSRLFRSTTGFVAPNTLPATPKFIEITNGDPNLPTGTNVGIPKISSSPFTPSYPVIITDIAVDPKNHLRVWLTVTGYQGGTNTNYRVIYSNNGGHSWTNWAPYGKIPFPVNSIVYQEGTNDRLVIWL